MFFLRGYVLEESGVYYKNKPCTAYSVCEKGDDLDLCLFKILELTNIYKFPVSQTPERPYLRWWEDGIKKADGHINSTKYQTIRVGEKVTLVDNRRNDFIKCKVIFKHTNTILLKSC